MPTAWGSDIGSQLLFECQACLPADIYANIMAMDSSSETVDQETSSSISCIDDGILTQLKKIMRTVC